MPLQRQASSRRSEVSLENLGGSTETPLPIVTSVPGPGNNSRDQISGSGACGVGSGSNTIAITGTGVAPNATPEPISLRNYMYQSPQLVSESSRQAAAGSHSKLSVHGSVASAGAVGLHPPQTAQANVTSNLRAAKTFIRPQPPQELLANPTLRDIHVRASISVSSPLHNNCGKVAGTLDIKVRKNPKGDDVRLGRVSIDLLGIEELSWQRRSIFFSIASELLDEDHPPPLTMLTPTTTTNESQNSFFRLQPSRSSIPFMIQLPADIGPGSFYSARASIRYIFHATLLLSINGVRKLVRCCRDINIIPLLDMKSILKPLEVPLTASEEISLVGIGPDILSLTASLQRSIWISGSIAYVDISVQNQTIKTIKHVRLKLVRHVISFKNSIAQTAERSVGHIRAPSWLWRKTVSRSELNVGSRWRGLKGGANEHQSFTCEVEIPHGELSIPQGRYFEVKYFIDVAASTRWSKRERVKVQLPITIVHMNSIDPIVLSNHSYNMDTLGVTKSKSHRSASYAIKPRDSLRSSYDREVLPTTSNMNNYNDGLRKRNSGNSRSSIGYAGDYTLETPKFEAFITNAEKEAYRRSFTEGDDSAPLDVT